MSTYKEGSGNLLALLGHTPTSCHDFRAKAQSEVAASRSRPLVTYGCAASSTDATKRPRSASDKATNRAFQATSAKIWQYWRTDSHSSVIYRLSTRTSVKPPARRTDSSLPGGASENGPGLDGLDGSERNAVATPVI